MGYLPWRTSAGTLTLRASIDHVGWIAFVIGYGCVYIRLALALHVGMPIGAIY